MEEQPVEQGRMWRFKRFVRECFRVLKVTKKPDRAEFTTTVKVSGMGIAIIGLIGFLVHLIKVLFIG